MLQSDRSDQVHWHRWGDWYTSSRTTSNEASQISPNLYEARNLRLTIGGDRPIRPFASAGGRPSRFVSIAGGKSRLTLPQSPNVMSHTLEHESDIAKPLDLLRVLCPCGGESIVFRTLQEVSRCIQGSWIWKRS
jgi:hypothetical protein